jgi:ABC-type phosphate transport system substrate-binding protein
MKRYLILFFITMATVLGVPVIGSNTALAQEKIVVIVNKENPVATLNAGQAKLYYLRKVKRIWPTINEPIKPVTRKGNAPVKNTFCNKVVAMSPTEMENYFTQRQFANSESLPMELNSDAEVINYVAENKGGIGYVTEAAYNAAKDKVKAVLTL